MKVELKNQEVGDSQDAKDTVQFQKHDQPPLLPLYSSLQRLFLVVDGQYMHCLLYTSDAADE